MLCEQSKRFMLLLVEHTSAAKLYAGHGFSKRRFSTASGRKIGCHVDAKQDGDGEGMGDIHNEWLLGHNKAKLKDLLNNGCRVGGSLFFDGFLSSSTR